MVDNNFTAIAVILDKSGSMYTVVDDTIGGFNNFVAEQRKLEGRATLSLTLFDTTFERRYVNVPLDSVADLTRETYKPSGMTALIDAVGTTIDELGRQLAAMPESQRPGKVLVVVQTDGMENSSREYTSHKVSEMIKHQENAFNWAFLFLGADQDAWGQANKLGIRRANTISYANTKGGNAAMYAAVSEVATAYRGGMRSANNLTGNEQGTDLRDNG